METPRVELDNTLYEKRLAFRVFDSTERVAGGWRRDREFRPEHLRLLWADTGEGWRLVHARVVGPMWRKDGTTGQVTVERDYNAWNDNLDQAPEWVRELIAEHAPTAVTA